MHSARSASGACRKATTLCGYVAPGFELLTIKSIHLSPGEQRSLPDLELSIGRTCGGGAVLDYMRLLTPSGDGGNVGGTVRLDYGPLVGNSPSVNAAEVVLLCGGRTPCGATRTDAQGHFLFSNVASGEHAI